MRKLKAVLRDAAGLPELILKAIAEVVMAVMRVIAQLLGARIPAPLSLPMPRTTVADVREGLRDDLQTHRTLENAMTFAPGAAVHAYACAETEEVRSSVNLDALSDVQKAWILALSERELRTLAAAGAEACQRAADGRRSGIVGLPRPGGITEEQRAESRQERIRAALRERILTTRQSTVLPR